MGGTGVLPNCGKYHYQLILSRKHLQLLQNGQKDIWGFTLVRLHIVKGTEYKNSWYEYCVDENGKIPSFPCEPLSILPNGEVLEVGTFIKLYNYSLEDPSVITLGLWRAINRFLHAPALPILLYEARDYKGHSPSKVLLGNKARVLVDDRYNIEDHFVINVDLGDFGQRNIEITLFKEGTSKTEYTTQNDAIFFTINGQTHATISRSFLKTKAKLPYLADYLLIHIDCTDVDTNIRENTFMASRDRMRISEHSREIEEILANELAKHEGLKKLNELRRERLVSKNPKDTEFMEKLVSNLIKSNRSLLAYLNLGGKIKDIKQPGTEEIEKFEGSYFPTYLRIKNWDATKGTYRKEIPVNSFAVIKLETDAPNDYFDRSIDSGKLIVSPIIEVKSYSLFNGNISLKIAPKENVKVGDIDTIEVELTRTNDTSLRVGFEVKYTPPVEPKKTPEGEKSKPKGKDYKLPEPQLVYKEKKEDYSCWEDHGWAGADIAKVVASTEGGNGEKGEKLDVYINMDADDLHNFLRRKQVSQKQQEIYTRSYETAIFLNSLVIYNELRDTQDKEEILPQVMRGISKITLDLMWNEEILKELESG